MPIFDAILLIILAGFVFYGLFYGFVRTVGMFVGVIVGAVLASRLYLPISVRIDPAFFGYGNLGKVLVFIVLFSLVNRLVGFVFYLADRVFKIFSLIPFFKTFNRLGGGVLGFMAGSLAIGLVLYVASRYVFVSQWAGQWLVNSRLAPFFLRIAKLLLPLLPKMLRELQGLI